jgi:hypothetical protein
MTSFFVMAGFIPAINVLALQKKDVDARVKPGHDELRELNRFESYLGAPP